VKGRVLLVGAGPGDPDLLTVRAARELARAEVLLYDALIAPELLELVSPDCERIDVGKRGDGSKGVAQDKIADLLIEKARAGKRVVRLKGGDPFVFGRGAEEASRLRAAGIAFEIVPGITSAIAVPEYAGIPVTDRRLSSSVAVVTGHRGKDEVDHRVDWEGLSSSAETLVVLMGTAWLDDIVARIIAGGRDPATPAAAIARGTTPEQAVVVARLRELPERVRAAKLAAPTVVVVGRVVEFREQIAWYELLPLFAKRVLVPRSASQRGELELELVRHGARPVPVALIDFVASADPQALAESLARAASYDWIVFTSANAVRFGAPAAGALGRARIACVGAATAQAARAAGLSVAAQPTGESTPESLVAELARQGELRGARVLFPRAAGARETLVRELEARGAAVDAPEAYRTVTPAGAADSLRAALEQGLDAALFTSPSTVEHCFASLASDARARFANSARFACLGPTTAAALRAAAPAARCEVAHEQTMPALVTALERAYGDNDHGLP
jgi:uroporphyrinogen III methyltransferase/synthase